MQSNGIGVDGVRYVTQALEHNASITTLRLGRLYPEEEVIKAKADEHIEENKKLLVRWV